MRKNTIRVFGAWRKCIRDNKEKRKSIWTDGIHVYSYNTIILVTPDNIGEPYRLNMTKYSRTTSNHQNSLRALLIQNNYRFVERVCPFD